MNKLVVILAVTASACQPHNKDLETKLDKIAQQLVTTQQDLEALHHEIDALATAPQNNSASLEHKIDEIAKQLQRVSENTARPAPYRPARPEPDREKTYAIRIAGEPSVGPDDAAVTLVLAYDYADPYTNRNRDTLVDLRKKYGKDLRIVYRNFVVHPQVATAGALAACAAAKQQKFVAYDALLWDKAYTSRNFDKDSSDSPITHCWETAAGCPVTLGYAKDLHLDLGRFKSDMKTCEPELQRTMAELQKFGVGATPTFFINGRYTSGAMPIDNFITIIDDELAKANTRIAAGTTRAHYYQEWVLDRGLTSLVSP